MIFAGIYLTVLAEILLEALLVVSLRLRLEKLRLGPFISSILKFVQRGFWSFDSILARISSQAGLLGFAEIVFICVNTILGVVLVLVRNFLAACFLLAE